jgi:hypothetical protein
MEASLASVLKLAANVVWAVSTMALSTAIGAIYGWHQHGTVGAIALGFVGFVVGTLLAASPMLVLQLLQ